MLKFFYFLFFFFLSSFAQDNHCVVGLQEIKKVLRFGNFDMRSFIQSSDNVLDEDREAYWEACNLLQDSSDSSPFYHACVLGKLDLVNNLLDKKFLNAEKLQKEALMLIDFTRRNPTNSSYNKKLKDDLSLVLNRLIDEFGFDARAEIEIQGRKTFKMSLLSTLIAKGFKFETIKKLIDGGADIHGTIFNSGSYVWGVCPPLYSALKANREDVFDYLVLKGATFNSNKLSDLKFLFHSVKLQSLKKKIITFAYSQLGSDFVNELFVGSLSGLPDVSNYEGSVFLEFLNKCNVNSCLDGQSALMWAVRSKSATFAKELIKMGANVNFKSDNLFYDGMTVLHLACDGRNFDVVKLLVDNGADVNAKDKFGRTPLFYLYNYEDHAKVVDLLLDYGADINEQDSNGNTILYSDVSLKLLDFFLKKGVDVNLVNNKGKTVVEDLFSSTIEKYRNDVERFGRTFVKEGLREKIDRGLLLLDYGGECSKFRIDTLSKLDGFVTTDQLERYNKIRAERLKTKTPNEGEIRKNINRYLGYKKSNSIFSKVKSLFSSDPSVHLLSKINRSSLSTLGVLQKVVAHRMKNLDPVSDCEKYSKLRIVLLTIAKRTAQYVFVLNKIFNNHINDKSPLFFDHIVEDIIYKNFSILGTSYEITLKSGQKILFRDLVKQEYQKMCDKLSNHVVDSTPFEVELYRKDALRYRKQGDRVYQSLPTQE